jgi:hypothetical protein
MDKQKEIEEYFDRVKVKAKELGMSIESAMIVIKAGSGDGKKYSCSHAFFNARSILEYSKALIRLQEAEIHEEALNDYNYGRDDGKTKE